MKGTAATLLGAAIFGVAVTACSPAIQLREPTTFTVKKVRDVSWNDRCNLQPFFDQKPSPNTLVSEVSRSAFIGSSREERGQVTYQVAHPLQQAMLWKILRRYYRDAPSTASRIGVQIEVGYYRYCGKTRMLVGSPIVIRTPTTEHRLAYHPCVGEYLLNGDLYRFRSKHLLPRYARK
ncbi:MAG: hypothetical protein ABI333_04800 [bacterium]